MLDACFTQAKITIVYSRTNQNRSSGTHCVVTLFKAKVISRVNLEYQFASFLLCKVENDNIVFLLIDSKL